MMNFVSICVIPLITAERYIFLLNTDPNPTNKLKCPIPKPQSSTFYYIGCLKRKNCISPIFFWVRQVWF